MIKIKTWAIHRILFCFDKEKIFVKKIVDCAVRNISSNKEKPKTLITTIPSFRYLIRHFSFFVVIP